MSKWYETGYPGGPMVQVAGFPRPLYPPDASNHGKQPSKDGPDVEAYKRTVSRAGRWPWQSFDEAFSNSFAHGKANVAETGIAGIQRQQKLDATGWVGEKTFNTLRSIRIPEGLPHAGEPAMDATAVNLVNEAYYDFLGSEPVAGSLRKSAFDLLLAEVGYIEGSNNDNKFGAWYGMNHEPYCAMAVTWAYEHAGDSPSFRKGSAYAYCPYIVADARAGNNGLKTTDDPVLGDLVLFDWAFDGTYDHVGLFERWLGDGDFATVEANTSPDSNGSQSNGGGVWSRTRNRSSQGTVFVRVAEP